MRDDRERQGGEGEAGGDAVAPYRPLLFSIAYRMLGSVMDAEDIVQETFLRWQQADRAAVALPKAYLTTVVTRLCIDHLRSARIQREEYAGPWLPEPLATEGNVADTSAPVLADSLSLAFLVLLESLNPVERAVFLLHDVFAYSYDEIAAIVGKSAPTCRQIAVRARRAVQARRPRFTPSSTQREHLTRRFVQASTEGDMPALLALLADDVIAWTDGGGKVSAARRPIHGAINVARYLLGIRVKAPGAVSRLCWINGQPGLVAEVAGEVVAAGALEIAGERIAAIYVVANPDKLHGLALGLSHPGSVGRLLS